MLTKIRKKAAKLGNVYIFREKKGAIPCFWHLGSPNFGDDLNPELLAQLSGQPVWRNKKQNTQPREADLVQKQIVHIQYTHMQISIGNSQ